MYIRGAPRLDKPHICTVIAWDFNGMLNAFVDKSQCHKLTKTRMALKLHIKDLGLCDIWQFIHPVSRGYSYFSPVHGLEKTFGFIRHPNKLGLSDTITI
uniref:Uncharacterized protein n=1 Tax=Chrysemys picta bellii TaxID=8478 RepID=A0A8C3F5K5_CHRPI